MMREATSVVLLLSSLLLKLCAAYPSRQPLIGVLMQKTAIPKSCKGQYTVTTYKSFIEQGGGGAVPIFVDQPEEYYEQLIPRLNGVLLPGGGIDNVTTSPFGKVAAKIWKMAMEMNDAGIHYPIWGTCQGFEDMTTWPTGTNVLSNCSGTFGVSLPVNFTEEAQKSKLYFSMPNALWKTMATEHVTPNYHSLCLTTKTYENSYKINDFYTVLTTNIDSNGVQFVSSIESRRYPFYGVQFHPEKINFFHTKGIEINQSLHAILVGQYMGNFLVSEARKNHNSFRSFDEEGRFIFNKYQHTFIDSIFEEIYCLTEKDVPPFEI